MNVMARYEINIGRACQEAAIEPCVSAVHCRFWQFPIGHPVGGNAYMNDPDLRAGQTFDTQTLGQKSFLLLKIAADQSSAYQAPAVRNDKKRELER